MKIKITMKEIRNRFKTYRCGYCDLQYIMRWHDAEFYNCGVYGWNCDIYVDWKHGIAITTGYRNMAGDRIPSEILEEYTNKAKEIESIRDWKEQERLYTENREAFFEAVSNL